MDHNEIATLKAELHRMQARLDELEARPDEPVNRRNMLRGIGAAAAGAAVGGLAFARPAAASDGNNLVIGNDSQTAQTPTWLIPSSSWSYDTGRVAGAFTVTNDSSLNNINAGLSCISAYADSTKTGGFNILQPIPRDPVVLFPTKHGLVIVSKWGVEADYDEFK